MYYWPTPAFVSSHCIAPERSTLNHSSRFSADVFGWFVQLTDSGISGDHFSITQVFMKYACVCSLSLTLQYLQIRETEHPNTSTRIIVSFRAADIERLGLLSIPQVRSNRTMYVRSDRHALHLQGDAAAACRLCGARNAHCIRLAVRASKATPCPDGLVECTSAKLPLESSSAVMRAQETKKLPETAWRPCVK